MKGGLLCDICEQKVRDDNADAITFQAVLEDAQPVIGVWHIGCWSKAITWAGKQARLAADDDPFKLRRG